MRILTSCLLLLLFSGIAAAETLHDPLRPRGLSASVGQNTSVKLGRQKEPDWQLTATLCSEKRVVAVINGQTAQVGDKLNGYRVKAIERDKVLLTKGNRTIEVLRAGTGLKKTSILVAVDGKEGRSQ